MGTNISQGILTIFKIFIVDQKVMRKLAFIQER